MSKRLVDIDDDLLERARAAAGTTTIKATVEAGLRRLADEKLALRGLRRLRKTAGQMRKHFAAARAPRFD